MRGCLGEKRLPKTSAWFRKSCFFAVNLTACQHDETREDQNPGERDSLRNLVLTARAFGQVYPAFLSAACKPANEFTYEKPNQKPSDVANGS